MQHKQSSGSFGSFVLGFLLGTGLGAVVALLKAPQSGDETRRQLQRAADEFRREADSVVATTKSHLQEAKEQLGQHAAAIKAESEAAIEEAKKVLAEGARDVEQEAKEGARKVRQKAKSEA